MVVPMAVESVVPKVGESAARLVVGWVVHSAVVTVVQMAVELAVHSAVPKVAVMVVPKVVRTAVRLAAGSVVHLDAEAFRLVALSVLQKVGQSAS